MPQRPSDLYPSIRKPYNKLCGKTRTFRYANRGPIVPWSDSIVCRDFVANFASLAFFLHMNLRKERPKQFCPLVEKDSAAVVPFKDPLIGPLVLRLPRRKGLYTLDAHVCDRILHVKLYKYMATELTTLMATGLLHITNSNRSWPQRTDSSWELMGCHTFVPVFWRSCCHNLDRSWSPRNVPDHERATVKLGQWFRGCRNSNSDMFLRAGLK